MRRMLTAFLFFALAATAVAQNTPAPCDPANLQATDVKYGCYNTPDCVTGFMCFYTRVLTDVFYGTTCEVIPMYLCSSPNNPNEASTKCSKPQMAQAFSALLRTPVKPVTRVTIDTRYWWKRKRA